MWEHVGGCHLCYVPAWRLPGSAAPLPTWDQASPCEIFRTPPSGPDSEQHRQRGVATVGSDMAVEQHKRRANLGRSAGSDLPREISS